MHRAAPRRSTDPILLAEVGLVLLLIALFIGLYFAPSGQAGFVPRWWVWPILVGLFFGILLLERWRRKRRTRKPLAGLVPEIDPTPPSGER